jgi:hypothetical protein
VPGFLLPFGYRHSLPEPSCARCGIPPSLRSAYQTTLRLDLIGVVTFHMRQIRPGWVPSGPRGRWCAPTRPSSSGWHLPRSQRLVPISHCCFPSAGVIMTRRQRGFTLFTRPVFPGL